MTSLLAIDTSTAYVGIALFDGVRILAESTWTSPQHHTVELAPAVAALLARCGLPVDRIDALGVAVGPGSFTSLRVGLAFAKGLAMARRIPIIGIRSLDIIAAAQPGTRTPLAAVMQAGRGRLAIGWYRSKQNAWLAEGAPFAGTANSLADLIRQPTLVAGELTADDRQRLARKRVKVALASPSRSVRRPAVLAELAWERWQQNDIDEPATLAPIYLHTAATQIT